MKAFNFQPDNFALMRKSHPYVVEGITIVVLVIVAGIASYLGSRLIGEQVLDKNQFGDTWFDSDVSAYFLWIKNRLSSLHVRTYKHPLFSMILCLPVYGLKALGIELIVAMRFYMAVIAGLWLGTLYLLLRLLGCRQLDAILFSALGATSAASIFWLVVPESYPFGSLSLMVAAILTLLAQSRILPWWSYLATNVFSISITITNWMAGLLATLLAKSKKQALQIFTWTLGIVTVLAGVQKIIFPKASFPPFIPQGGEVSYLFSPESGGILKIIQSEIAHTIVMPQIQVLPHPRSGEPIMLTQFSVPGSGSLWGAIAVGVWMALLALGIWAFLSLKTHHKFRLFLGLLLLGQFGLHLVYTGRETFLYSLHFAPFLIVLAAFSTLTRSRLWSLGLASILLICITINNGIQFNQAIEFYQTANSSALTSSLNR